ncbi:lipoprotein [Actinoalloteichus hymeniacidonis]|uniref:DUF3558 family protein n=1 Tax=Actinoalloteichus hymeniacidonis TaxID=340345 RepID=A0AAC9HPN7_9PSEU|nr:lipoprotein [Actinoalloteichus hymeniacidonis]AOS63099.1 hypothetical protein TL08_11425 [Actinoalloteichus hymeniacidonis]MBB5908865.1 hypothetical protein [Actinoalloteichus hymeniacidonis]
MNRVIRLSTSAVLSLVLGVAVLAGCTTGPADGDGAAPPSGPSTGDGEASEGTTTESADVQPGGSAEPDPSHIADDPPGSNPGAPGAPAPPGEVAQSGVTVGSPDGPCPLPVSLSAAADWEVMDVTDLDIVMHGLVPLCELHGRHAGVFGSIRVNTSQDPASDATTALEAYASEAVEGVPEFRDVVVDGTPAVEVSLFRAGEWQRQELALAVDTEAQPIIVTLTGLDLAEFESGLPAYRLAVNTLHING